MGVGASAGHVPPTEGNASGLRTMVVQPTPQPVGMHNSLPQYPTANRGPNGPYPQYPRQKIPPVNVHQDQTTRAETGQQANIHKDSIHGYPLQQQFQQQQQQSVIRQSGGTTPEKSQSEQPSQLFNQQPSATTDPVGEKMANHQAYSRHVPTLPPIRPESSLTSQQPQSGTYSNNYITGQPVYHSGRPGSGRPGSARMGYWDSARDMVLTRILSADEFFGRMAETDEMIRSWTACEEAHQKYVRLKELLGLRGHLQDELLRIEAMLAEDDQELRSLNDFQNQFPQVIGKLRELNTMSRRIQIQSTDIGLDPHTATGSTSTGVQTTSGSSSWNTGSPIGVPTPHQHVSVQSVTEHDQSEASDNEEELRRKFTAEEEHIAGDFAEKLARHGRHLEQEDVDHLLKEHSLHMQALRMKQDIEKQKHKERLEAKKKNRLRHRKVAEQKRSSSGRSRSKAKKAEAFYVDLSTAPDSIEAKEPIARATSDESSSGPKKWFSVDMNGLVTRGEATRQGPNAANSIEGPQRQGTFTKEPVDALQRQETFTKQSTKDNHQREGTFTAEGDKEATPKEGKDKDKGFDTDDGQSLGGSDKKDDQDNDYEDDFEEDDESNGEDSIDLKRTLKDDLWSTLEKGSASSKTLEEIMKSFRNQEENRKALKDAEKDKLDEKRLAKLSQKKTKNASSSNEIETQTDSVSMSSISTDTDNMLEKELQAIREKDNKLVEELMRKRQSLSDADFHELLKKHLSDVESLRQRRARDQDRLKEKLKEKLRQRKAKNGEGGDYSSSTEEDASSETELIETSRNADQHLDRELTKLDERLAKELKNKGKTIDESDLTELLEHYRRQQEKLLRQKKQQSDKIKEKLQEKLKAKRDAKNKDNTHSEDNDDSFFHELSKLNNRGLLTEDMFSDMLKVYLDKVDKDKRKEKKREREQGRKESDRIAASSLVQEHQQHTKQIKGIRQREKDIMDEKLKRKLLAKRTKAQ